MIPEVVRFWLFLVFLVPAIGVSLFVLFRILHDRTSRNTLSDHIIILLIVVGLIMQVTVFPWMLHRYRHEGTWEISYSFSLIWLFLDWDLTTIQNMLFAWATVERHILVFNDRWLTTKTNIFLLHYLPSIVIVLYCTLYYCIVFFFPPCENRYVYFEMDLCLTRTNSWLTYETTVHMIYPILVIVLFSFLLLMRVIWQKHRVHQSMRWRKHRKMILQLFSISWLYLFFLSPATVMNSVILTGVPYESIADAHELSIYLTYFLTLLVPFVCGLLLPKTRTRTRKISPLR